MRRGCIRLAGRRHPGRDATRLETPAGVAFKLRAPPTRGAGDHGHRTQAAAGIAESILTQDTNRNHAIAGVAVAAYLILHREMHLRFLSVATVAPRQAAGTARVSGGLAGLGYRAAAGTDHRSKPRAPDRPQAQRTEKLQRRRRNHSPGKTHPGPVRLARVAWQET